MKKVLSIMMIALIAVSSVFAASGYIGASSGYGFAFDKEANNLMTYFPVSVDGATFFNDGDFQFGLSYGAEIVTLPFQSDGPLDTKIDLKPLENYKWTLAPYAGLGFQYKFADSVGLAGSVNATYNWETAEEKVLGETVKVATHTLGMMGNLYLNMNLGPVNLRVGGLMEGPIGAWVTGKAGSLNASSDMVDRMGPFNVVPFAGIGLAY